MFIFKECGRLRLYAINIYFNISFMLLKCSGIEQSIMQVPQRLHITIVVLRLLDEAEEV